MQLVIGEAGAGYIIATKWFPRENMNPTAGMMEVARSSSKRLGVACLDLLLIHGPTHPSPVEVR